MPQFFRARPESLPRVQVRQGDVLLVPIDDIPAGATVMPRDQGRVVLAYGEATGHAHAISAAGATQLQDKTNRFLRLDAPAVLAHEEHAPITLAPGAYRVVIQREFVPPTPERTASWRQVVD